MLSLGLAALAIYVAGFGVFDEVWVRAGTTGLPILISLLCFSTENMDVRREDVGWSSIALNAGMLLALAPIYYLWIVLMTEQLDFFVEFSVFDYLVGFAGIALLFYLTYRHFGLPLFLVCLLSLVVLLFGNLIPGTLNIPEVKWFLISEKLWYSTDGVFGRPVAVVGQIVLVFILFGAILETSGAGATLLKFAFAVTGPLRGGPAHAAIIGSASFGTMNGAAVANVGDHRCLHHPDDQAHRLPVQIRRRGRGRGVDRRTDHAAGDGRGRVPDGGHYRDSLPDDHRRRGDSGADVLSQPVLRGLAGGAAAGAAADAEGRAGPAGYDGLDPLDLVFSCRWGSSSTC